MNRQEILDKLHNIKIGASISAYTYDMGIQYVYVTPEGYGESLGNMGDWPVFCIENITVDFLEFIREKIINKTLVEQDIANSKLYDFFRYVFNNKSEDRCYKELYEFLQDFVNVTSLEDNKLYILCDSLQWKPEASFFGSYRDVERAFADHYIFNVTKWEDCTDEELDDWLYRIEEELSGMIIKSFED